MSRLANPPKLSVLLRFLYVAVGATILCGLSPAVASAATPMVIPAGGTAVLSNATLGGCDNNTVGYQLNGGVLQPVATKPYDCISPPLTPPPALIGPVSTTSSLRIDITDDTCTPSVTYYSDGTSSGGDGISHNHALVVGDNPFQVAINDGGPGDESHQFCSLATQDAPPSSVDVANFTGTVTVNFPPNVTVTAPPPPAGQHGYFNSHDLAAGGGSIPVSVSAQGEGGAAVTGITCTDNGAPVTVLNQTGRAPRTGMVLVSATGVNVIACLATDTNHDNGNYRGANSAVVSIDNRGPSLSVPGSLVVLSATGAFGASLQNYGVSAADPDPGDTPAVVCTPGAPHQFALGDTPVVCVASDRAGNVASVQFVVRVHRTAPLVAVSCSVGTLVVGKSTSCSATVAKSASAGFAMPTGSVALSVDGGRFSGGGTCTLVGGSCSVGFTFVAGSGTFPVTASYAGDAVYTPGVGASSVAAAPPAGVAANVAVLSGTVFIRLPGHHAADGPGGPAGSFVPLKGETVSVPVGSMIDARKGVLRLATSADYRSASDPRHHVQTGTFSVAIFTIKQLTTRQALARARAQHQRRLTGIPSTDLQLVTPGGAVANARCRRAGPPGKGIVRAFSGEGKGLYRTFAANSITTVRSATWIVKDRCDGTLTEVGRGSATVTPTHGKHPHPVTVRSGQGVLIKGRFA